MAEETMTTEASRTPQDATATPDAESIGPTPADAVAGLSGDETASLVATLRELQREADELQREYADLSERAKAKKKRWEAAVERVGEAIRALDEPMPLFDKPKAEETPTADAAIVAEDWRSVLVSKLQDEPYNLSPRIVQKLAEADVLTIGDIQKLREQAKSLTDVKGIGEAAAEKIYNALDEFWRVWDDARVKAQAHPLPDEPEFNEETKQAIRDANAGIGLTRHDSVDEMFDSILGEDGDYPDDEDSE